VVIPIPSRLHAIVSSVNPKRDAHWAFRMQDSSRVRALIRPARYVKK